MKVLHLEDDPLDAELLAIGCTRRWPDFQATVVKSRGEFVTALRSSQFDVIVSDSGVALFPGTDALAVARQLSPNTPFIFVCGTMSDLRRAELEAAGPDAILSKDTSDSLVPTLEKLLNR